MPDLHQRLAVLPDQLVAVRDVPTVDVKEDGELDGRMPEPGQRDRRCAGEGEQDGR